MKEGTFIFPVTKARKREQKNSCQFHLVPKKPRQVHSCIVTSLNFKIIHGNGGQTSDQKGGGFPLQATVDMEESKN